MMGETVIQIVLFLLAGLQICTSSPLFNDGTLTVYRESKLDFYVSYGEHHNDTESETEGPTYPDQPSTNTWSIMWYLISFGGLILFFLLVSLSEVCCKKVTFPFRPRDEITEEEVAEDVISPPSYDEFAPPTYESLYGEKQSKKNKMARKIFVLPIHDKPRETSLAIGEVISRNSMGDGEVVTPPPPP